MFEKHGVNWAKAIATVGGIGYRTRMPGTFASFVACLAAMAIHGIPPWLLVAVITAGLWSSDRYEKERGIKDPPEAVIDEVAGMWVAMMGLPLFFALPAFVLFRIVDIWKPLWIYDIQEIAGGGGIMADDLLGGLVVNILLECIYYLLLFWGIFSA